MPDIQAQTPDGVIHSFPDGTPNGVIDKAIKAYSTDATLTGVKAPAQPNTPTLTGPSTGEGITAAEHPSNPFSRYMQEAENLTEEGKKQHPIQNFVGTTAKRLGEFGNIAGTTAASLLDPFMGGAANADAAEIGEAANARVAGPQRGPAAAQAINPEAPRAPVAGSPAGPAPAQAFTPLNRTPPNAAGAREFTGLRSSSDQAIIVPRTPARRTGENMLPAGPSVQAGIEQAAPAPEAVAGPAMPGATAGREATPAAGPAKSSKQQVSDLVDRALGVQPLKRDVPLREQLQAAGPVEKSPAANALEAKYPDKTLRRFVHANGEKIVDAVGDDPQTMEAIHGLTRVDLRQALLNAGFDAGQSTISESKFAGSAAIGRGEAFNTLLKMGYSPKEIIQLAKTP